MVLGLEIIKESLANLVGSPALSGCKEPSLVVALEHVVVDKSQAMFLGSVCHRCQHDDDEWYDEFHSATTKGQRIEGGKG